MELCTFLEIQQLWQASLPKLALPARQQLPCSTVRFAVHFASNFDKWKLRTQVALWSSFVLDKRNINPYESMHASAGFRVSKYGVFP